MAFSAVIRPKYGPPGTGALVGLVRGWVSSRRCLVRAISLGMSAARPLASAAAGTRAAELSKSNREGRQVTYTLGTQRARQTRRCDVPIPYLVLNEDASPLHSLRPEVGRLSLALPGMRKVGGSTQPLTTNVTDSYVSPGPGEDQVCGRLR